MNIKSPYFFDSLFYILTSYPYGFILFITLLGCFGICAFKPSWTLLLCFLLSSLTLIGFLSKENINTEVQFRKICSEDSGVFIYKKIRLDEKYLVKKNLGTRTKNIDSFYVINDDFVINEVSFKNKYSIKNTREQSKTGIEKTFLKIVDLDTEETISEVKNYYGGPNGFLSQLKRHCNSVFLDSSLLPYSAKQLIEDTFSK